MKNFLMAMACMLFLISCDKESTKTPNQSNSDFVIFGGIYGECWGDCRELYLINKDGLFHDADQLISVDSTIFNETPESFKDFILAKSLLDVPKMIELSGYEKSNLLRPWADSDYYIKGRIHGHEFKLVFSKVDPSAPKELKEYTTRMINIYSQIADR